MITKFQKYNEGLGIRHLLVGPTEEESLIPLYKNWKINRWELLTRSIKLDYIDGIKIALKGVGKVDIGNSFRMEILHCAIIKGDMELVQKMIKLGTKVRELDLLFASQYNQYDIFNYIMKKRPKGKDFNNRWVMLHVKQHGNKDIIELYQKEIDKSVNEGINHLLVGPTDEEILNNLKDKEPDYILLKSVEIGFSPGIIYAIKKGADFKENDSILLRRAAKNNNIELFKLLLEKGDDVHVRDEYVICEACERGYYDIVKLCIEYGADIYTSNNYPLLASSGMGFSNIVKLLLEKGTFNKNVIMEAIDYAESNNNHGVVKILKEYENNINEGIKSLLVGPTKEEVWGELMNGKLKGLIKTIPESPEDFFNQMIEGCEIIKSQYGNICWGKNNIVLFEESPIDELLHVNDKYIFSIIYKVYGINYTQIGSLMTEILKGTKWEGLSPQILMIKGD